MRASRQSLAAAGLSPADAARLGDGPLLAPARDWLNGANRCLLTQADPAFPDTLRALPDAPAALFCEGDPDLLSTLQLAIVGSRNPTPAGERHAFQFARALAGRGLAICSGLALGIDGAAHRGALAADGLTLAVTGCGLDICYPASHQALARDIAQRGLLLSEYPPGTAPQRENFPRRNRLISGLSFGTLVVEAAPRSGSLITARLAAEQGREVFAIPGSVDNPLARGCHRLIRAGAKLVETADDVLEELGPMMDNKRQPTRSEPPAASSALDEDYQLLLKHIDNAPMSIDALVEATGLPVDSVSSMLLILELQGAVAVAPGGGYQRSESR